jgi:hypothetical protein
VRRLKRKHVTRPAAPVASLSKANQEWSMDFVADGLSTGRALRIYTLVDSFTRECLALEVDSCLSSRRVTRVLDWVIGQRGAPEAIRCDNDRSLRVGISCRGARVTRSKRYTSSPAGRCKTATWKASTADSGTNA